MSSGSDSNKQHKKKFNFNSSEFIENRKKNNELLSKNGWICAEIKIDKSDSYLNFLNAKKWFISGQGSIWLPQLPRIGDYVTFTIMNKHLLERYGVKADYEQFITCIVNKIEMLSLSVDMNYQQVEESLSCLLYSIDVTITEIPENSDLDIDFD
ncbi:hypothetical protein RIVM261_078730 [Rivularia sp. IAM M-261]|nr:hypothetical protein RIVM261_078730 [Rivularia sp. IAM M-261]